MGGCHTCGGDRRMLYSCNYCNSSYCSTHRLPENHNCLGLKNANTLGPEFRREEKSRLQRAAEYVSHGDRGKAGKPHRDWEPSSTSPDVEPDGSIANQPTRENAENEAYDSLKHRLQSFLLTITGLSILLITIPFKLIRKGWRAIRSPTPIGMPNTVFLAVTVAAILLFAGVYGTGVGPIDSAGESAVEEAQGGVAALDNATTPRETNTSKIEMEVHKEVNEERDAAGRAALEFDDGLREIAYYHSERMATEEFFSHDAPNGESMGDRYDRFGYNCEVDTGGVMYATGGENIAQSYINERVVGHGRISDETEVAEAVVSDWMDSPGHRANLVSSDWRKQGIGVYVTENDKVYVTQNFC